MADQELNGAEHGIVMQLRELLGPVLGEERAEQMCSWVRHEIKTRPLVAYCWDGVSEKAYELGAESPISEGRIVFAMLHWESQKSVVAYCFKPIVVDGKNAVQFYREVIADPKHITGPVSHGAFFEDVRAFLVEDSAVEVERFCQYLGRHLDAGAMRQVAAAAADYDPAEPDGERRDDVDGGDDGDDDAGASVNGGA